MYHISIESGERYGWGFDGALLPHPVQLQRDPLEGGWLERPRTTVELPPDSGNAQVVLRDEGRNKWIVLPDVRAKSWYSIADGAEFQTSDPWWLPDGKYTEQQPRSPEEVWDGTRWRLPGKQLLAAALELINAHAKKLICGGFSSDALGSPHIYDSEPEDQSNLLGAALADGGEVKCRPPEGDKSWISHTGDEIRRVVAEGEARKQSILAFADLLQRDLSTLSDDELESYDPAAKEWPV